MLLSFLWGRRRHNRFIPFAFFCYDVLDGTPAGQFSLGYVRFSPGHLARGVCQPEISRHTYKPADETLSRVRLRMVVCGSREMSRKQQGVRRLHHARSGRHYHPALLQSRGVLRKDCSKFWVKRYAHFKRRFSKVYDRFFRGRDSIVEQRRVAVFTSRSCRTFIQS